MKSVRKSTKFWRVFRGSALLWVGAITCGWAAPVGEAILAAHVGEVEARLYTDAYHAGGSDLKSLSDGQAVGEGAKVMTGKKGQACMVLSPGAVICIAPETQVDFEQLRHVSDGLPVEESDLVRRIHMNLVRGRILVNAGTPSKTLDIQVRVPTGVIRSRGGRFVVVQIGDGQWAVIAEIGAQDVIPSSGEAVALPEGEAIRLSKDGATSEPGLLNISERKFEVCNVFFTDLMAFVDHPRQFDRAGLGRLVTGDGSIDYIGPVDSFRDVSPSLRRPGRSSSVTLPAAPTTPAEGDRWGRERIWSWYEQMGMVKGVNYVPRNAVNSTEMWMAEGFDKEIIDQELGWAQDAGFTAVRVQLQYVAWKADPDGFRKRFGQFVDLADENGLKVVPVLFDDLNIAGREPFVGAQPEPVPGVHNSAWMPSPGAQIVGDRDAWAGLKDYVRDVIGKHKRDKQILFWDLYNRPGDGGQGEASLPFMSQVFKWARAIDPKQPLAMAVWSRSGHAMDSWMLEQSDIITFQSYETATHVNALLEIMKRHDRPIVCVNWLMRQTGNTFGEILPIFARHHVGWFSHGLVKGRSQMWVQDAAHKAGDAPDVWQHDIFESNGDAYDPEEVQLIGEFKFQ